MTAVNRVHQLHWLLDIINRQYDELNYHLVFMWWKTYEIVDLNDYQRIIKRWTLDFLLWFCEWFLYIK